jgi:predicted transcriptional regulator
VRRSDLGDGHDMKVTVTLAIALVRAADRLARRAKKSRNKIVAAAGAEYVARHGPEAVTTALNRLAERLDTKLDEPLSVASRRRLRRSEW